MKRETGDFKFENGSDRAREDSNPHHIQDARRASLVLIERTTGFRREVLPQVVRFHIKERHTPMLLARNRHPDGQPNDEKRNKLAMGNRTYRLE